MEKRKIPILFVFGQTLLALAFLLGVITGQYAICVMLIVAIFFLNI